MKPCPRCGHADGSHKKFREVCAHGLCACEHEFHSKQNGAHVALHRVLEKHGLHENEKLLADLKKAL